jgi:large subunit ribosomal protein L24
MGNKVNKSKTFRSETERSKKGDRVVVIAGAYKDRERVREVLEVFPDKEPRDC